MKPDPLDFGCCVWVCPVVPNQATPYCAKSHFAYGCVSAW